MRVAVVGAGVSGLPAIKCCRDEGLDVVCFETRNDLGGLWNYTETVLPGQSNVARSVIYFITLSAPSGKRNAYCICIMVFVRLTPVFSPALHQSSGPNIVNIVNKHDKMLELRFCATCCICIDLCY